MTKIPIAQPSTGTEEESAAAVVIRSGMLAQGPAVAEFEEKFRHYCDVKHAIAVNNGTAALHAALACAGIKTGDEVIVPTFSFFATASCVLMCGATPVFVNAHTDSPVPADSLKKHHYLILHAVHSNDKDDENDIVVVPCR